MLDSEILFRKIKNIALREPVRSSAFINFVKEKSGGDKDFHHVFGSQGSLKSTDLLGVAVSREEHTKGEGEREWIISKLPEAIWNLLQYVKHLEEELSKKDF